MRKKSVGLILVILVLFLCARIGASEGAPILEASPSWVKPGERILVRFSSAPGNNSDWIAMYSVGEESGKYGEWYYLKGKTNGELTFTAPTKEGNYEFRFFANWPDGGYEAIAITNVVGVGVSGPPELYKDVFRLSTGMVIFGELLNFDGNTFRIRTEKGVVEKGREEIIAILVGVAQ